MNERSGFTGRQRRKTTKRRVVFADMAARLVISLGGIGTIVAVLLVAVFLIWVVLPLFEPAEITEKRSLAFAPDPQPWALAVDEYAVLGMQIARDGQIHVFRLDNGAVRQQSQPFAQRTITCASVLRTGGNAVFGFDDGTIQILDIRFKTSYLRREQLEDDLAEQIDRAIAELDNSNEPERTVVDYPDGVIQFTRGGVYRVQQLQITPVQTVQVSNRAIHRVDHIEIDGKPIITVLSGSGAQTALALIRGRMEGSALFGDEELTFDAPLSLPYKPIGAGDPNFLGLTGDGRQLFVVWEDGWCERINCVDPQSPFISETGRLIPEGRRLRCVDFVLGDQSLVWADSHGLIQGGYLVRTMELVEGILPDSQRDPQRNRMALAVMKDMSRPDAVMSAFGASGQSRIFLAGFDNGQVRLYNLTHAGSKAEIRLGNGSPIRALAMAPKEDGFLATTDTGLFFCRLDAPHTDASLAAAFAGQGYEGYPQRQHMWQSSSGEQSAELKWGTLPLVFGTLKATFYSMLFGAPLALLAAVYSSEFLHSRVKAWIKPIIELMASLPSVVLGFLAAMVFAERIERAVPWVMSVFFCVPLMFLVGAYLWQLLPRKMQARLDYIGTEGAQGRKGFNPFSWLLFHLGGMRLVCLLLLLGAGIWIASYAGPFVERLLFAGDIKDWLMYGASNADPKYQSPVGGWMLVLLPISILLVAYLMSRVVNPRLRQWSRSLNRGPMALLDFGKFLLGLALTLGFCFALGYLLYLGGCDPRKPLLIGPMDLSPMGTYVQRNSLVVGFVMGFAIIPIIYTIADDALSSVPEHLRSASLGAGATPWQTAVRIIIPVAMSGLFSALMIGLGRAVGETMIVLMAWGNTPITDLNLFNGGRPLSANIAVELPEAARNSTHYRFLFWHGLILFAMTFVINTIAEAVRLRFRKRAYQL